MVVSIRKNVESALAICGDNDAASTNEPVAPGSIGYYRALVRSKKGVERFFVPNTLVDPSLMEDDGSVGAGMRGSGSQRSNTPREPSNRLRGKRHRGAQLARALVELASPLLDGAQLIKANNKESEQRLVAFENSLIMSGYKFGVLYAAPGQTTEEVCIL